MAGGPLDTKQTTTLEADDRAFRKTMERLRREQEAADAKQDVALAKQLAAQGKLTEEAFNTARAQAQGANAAGKAVDLVGAKVKEFGQSIIGGLVTGFGAGLLGGGVGSIVQKLFAPPTDGDLAQMARATVGYDAFSIALRRAAEAEIDVRRETALAAEATKGYAQVIESITHAGELQSLQLQLKLATEEADKGFAGAEEAVKRFRKEITDLTDPTIKSGIEDLYKTLFGTAAKNFVEVIKKNDELIQRQKEWAEQTKAVKASIESLVASLDPLAAEQLKLDQTWEQLSKGVEHTVITEAQRTEIFQRQAEALYQVRIAAEEAEAARRAEISDLTGEGPASRGDDRLIDTTEGPAEARRRALLEAEQAQERAIGSLALQEEKKSPLEKLLGTPDEIDWYVKAYEGLTSAIQASYSAIVTGSDSAIGAGRKVLAQLMLAEGQYAIGMIAKEAALVVTDWTSAPRHLLGVAKWTAAAALWGYGASKLGGGGSGSGAGASAGGGSGGGFYGSGAGGDPNRGTERMIVVGDSNSTSSPRFEAAKARRYAALAGASNDRVRYE